MSAGGHGAFLAVLLLPATLAARTADPVRKLNASVEGLVRAVEAKGSAKVGIEIRSLDRSETLVQRRSDRLFAAASNTKLLVTATALAMLGRDAAFETRFLAAGPVESGTLRGPLLVRGGGDPCLSSRFHPPDAAAAFEPVVAALEREGIRRIEQGLLLDARAFDAQTVAPGWPRDQLAKDYCAPVAALNLNEGCVEISVSAGAAGAPARVRVLPGGSPFRLVPSVTTVPGRPKTIVDASFADGTTLRVRGTIGAQAPPYAFRLSVPDPVSFFGNVLAGALRARGIEVLGEIRALAPGEDPPAGGREVASLRSPLYPALVAINKASVNVCAEHVLKSLGASFENDGSWEGGIRAVRKFLEREGIGTDGFAMADGSGLSRDNRFSPALLVSLLERMWKSPEREDFFLTLPKPGEPGTTLGSRGRTAAVRDAVRAKTGWIAGASALSGYVRTVDDEALAFSILVNDAARTPNHVFKTMQDEIVRLLAGFSRDEE